MTRLATIATVAASAALLFGSGVGTGWSAARNASQRAVWAAEDHAIALADSLEQARDSVRVDSVRIDSVVTRWRIARADIDTITDTVRLVDTLRILVAQGDSALNLCTEAFLGCNDALALAERRAAADSATQHRLRELAAVEAARADRAEARSWRHRFEGAAVCGLSAFTIYRLTRE